MGIVAPVAVLQAKDRAFIDQPSSSRVVNRGLFFHHDALGSGVGIGDVNHRLNGALRGAAVDGQRPDLQREASGLAGLIHLYRLAAAIVQRGAVLVLQFELNIARRSTVL